jgi:hypothetical protein
VAAVGVLAVMTLLATMSLMAGGADLLIATRFFRERAAFYAAESALETAMEELGSGAGPIAAASLRAPWPPPGIAVRRWQEDGWACSRRICLIPDVGDADGDADTTVVLFARGFGFEVSPLLRGGSPVVQLLVTAERGESRQAVVAEVAAVTCAPLIPAAWTVAGPLDLNGDVIVAGEDGLLAVAGPSQVRLFAGAVIQGEQVADPSLPQLTGVLEIINAGGTLPRLDELPEPIANGSREGLFWSRGDYSGLLDGSGIFIVHNPAFDPVKHEASRIALEGGVPGAGYDPAYSHLDPARQPARLDIPSGGAFEGVVIADVVGDATAPFTLTGALVTLTRSPQAVAASSPLRIIGSRAAIARSGRGALRHRVGFRPIPPPTAEFLDPCP